jgi:hypothetical protein
MDSMYDIHGQGENNLKDMANKTENEPKALTDSQMSLSYKKVTKLVAALFMVTDVMDKEEPIRHKLRTLGTEILSDTLTLSHASLGLRTELLLSSRIQEVIQFLHIGEIVNLFSKMNAQILLVEFKNLQKSISDYEQNMHLFDGKATLSEFFATEEKFSITPPIEHTNYPIGRIHPTRLGVQKGSTLMKALSDKIMHSSVGVSHNDHTNNLSFKSSDDKMSYGRQSSASDNFDMLRKQRRNEICAIIKNNRNVAGTSITDIRKLATGVLNSTSEKTLQRELIAMVTEGVLKKTGTKRWSRYFLS